MLPRQWCLAGLALTSAFSSETDRSRPVIVRTKVIGLTAIQICLEPVSHRHEHGEPAYTHSNPGGPPPFSGALSIRFGASCILYILTRHRPSFIKRDHMLTTLFPARTTAVAVPSTRRAQLPGHFLFPSMGPTSISVSTRGPTARVISAVDTDRSNRCRWWSTPVRVPGPYLPPSGQRSVIRGPRLGQDGPDDTTMPPPEWPSSAQ